jgi:hypothetical protein
MPCWAGGGVFWPTQARARARLAAQSAQQRGTAGETVLQCVAHMPARGREFNDVGCNGGRGEVDRSSIDGGIRGGSPPWVRFCGREVVVRHGRGQAITGVGSIWPAGA